MEAEEEAFRGRPNIGIKLSAQEQVNIPRSQRKTLFNSCQYSISLVFAFTILETFRKFSIKIFSSDQTFQIKREIFNLYRVKIQMVRWVFVCLLGIVPRLAEHILALV